MKKKWVKVSELINFARIEMKCIDINGDNKKAQGEVVDHMIVNNFMKDFIGSAYYKSIWVWNADIGVVFPYIMELSNLFAGRTLNATKEERAVIIVELHKLTIVQEFIQRFLDSEYFNNLINKKND